MTADVGTAWHHMGMCFICLSLVKHKLLSLVQPAFTPSVCCTDYPVKCHSGSIPSFIPSYPLWAHPPNMSQMDMHSSSPLTFSGCATGSLLLDVKQTSTGCPDPHRTFDFFWGSDLAVSHFSPNSSFPVRTLMELSCPDEDSRIHSWSQRCSLLSANWWPVLRPQGPSCSAWCGTKTCASFHIFQAVHLKPSNSVAFWSSFQTEQQRQMTHTLQCNSDWRKKFHILLSLPLCLYYCHGIHFHGDASSLSQIAFIIETLYIYMIYFNRLESKWIIVWLMILRRMNVLINSSPTETISCWHFLGLSMSSHPILLGFIIMTVSLLCCTAWKGLEILVSLSLPGHMGGGGLCLQMWYSDLSKWYTAAITQHMLKKTPSNRCRKDRLW